MTRQADDNDQQTLYEGTAKNDLNAIIVRKSSLWNPPTDIYKHQERLIVLIEIAGMQESDFEIVLQNRMLLVSGIRKHVAPSHVAYHQMEIQRGNFRIEIQIPWAVQREQVTAIYRDGLLKIELPHTEPRTIRVIDTNTQEETP
ncbi:Hsp20/alpha crystallin family protein [Chloroflexota bacterium]